MALFALFTAALRSPAAAQVTWTGATGNDWTVGSNWTGGTAPTAAQIATINSAANSPILGINGPAIGVTAQINVGALTGQTGVLTIQNGSTLTSGGQSRLGTVVGGTGIVTVTGAGSLWLITHNTFAVGWLGNGTLNIQDGGRVSAAGNTTIGNGAASSGTLNISGGGTLETSVLQNSNGAAQVNFDHGILKATASKATFINGFFGTALNILAGGLTIDTAGFAVGTDPPSALTGVGGLTVTGDGVFSLLANSPYSGQTWVQTGSTLSLQVTGAIASSSRVIADGTFDVTGATTPTIKSLAGSGAVTLGTNSLTITNANDQFFGIISGSGGLTVDAGTQTLSGANSYSGATAVKGGTLQAAAANTFSAASAFTVASGATLSLNGFNQTIAGLTNGGVANAGGLPGTTLTVTGDYTGANGLLNLNTSLQGDAAPTDKLVVQGSTAGSTTVNVNNVGGAGAPTVEGIKIIDVGGASAGIFALQGDIVFHGEKAVIAGAYAYTLHKNGVSTPTDGDWYLRSALVNPTLDEPPGPLFQPGVPLYESYPQILLSLMSMPTLRERIGYDALGGRGPAPMPAAYIDEGGSYLGGPPVAGYERAPGYRDVGNAWWGRVDASRISLEPSSTAAAAYDADQVRLQTGFDALIYADRAGKLLAGLTVQHGSSSARVDSVWGDGKINVEAYGIGGTLTWLGLNGFYVDTQAQVTWFDTDIRSSLAGTMTEGDDAVGYGISLETGKRFAAFGPWALTPQAQLSYTSVDLDFTDAFGAEVSTRNGDSLLGRVGIALDYRNAWLGARSNMYGIANLYYEFLDGTSIDVSGTRFVSSKDELWGGLGVGGMYSWGADKYALFGEVSVNTGLDFGDSYSVNGTAGFRIRW